jgi:hypothetical protein
MGACASRPMEENGPRPVAPPAEDSSIHHATTNPTEVTINFHISVTFNALYQAYCMCFSFSLFFDCNLVVENVILSGKG